MSCEHEFLVEGPHAQCHRCGIGRVWVDLRPRCEPLGATPAPAVADMLDRALSADPWDRIGRKHGR